MKKHLLVVTGFVLVAGSAVAADMRYPARGPAYSPPPPAPYFTWSGFYIGANAGWGSGKNDVHVAPSANAASQAFWNGAFAAGAAPSAIHLKPHGGFGGGQIGYNIQTGMFVFGVEADIQGSGIRDSVTVVTNVPGFVQGTHSVSQKLDWFGTVRGRLGVANGPALFYVTGGLAYGDVDYGLSYTFPGSNDFQNLSAKHTSSGWTVGGGAEWAFAPNWSLKGEYLFVDLGDRSFTTVPSGRAANLLTSYTATYNNEYHLARIGINYRFGGGSVYAKY